MITKGRAFAVLLAVAAGAARAQAPPLEVWALNEVGGTISVIDAATDTVVAVIDVSDPDQDRSPDPPRDLTFSTRPAAPGRHAFVVQDNLVTVVSVATRSVVRTVNVTTLAGVPPLVLTGCDASVPRRFDLSAGGTVLASHLHVAASRPTGGAMFLVLDQDALVSGTGNPLVASGTLASSGRALDVRVLDEPDGPRFARAWYTTADALPATEVRATLVTTTRVLGGAWGVGDQRVQPLPTPAGPPEGLRPGSPTGPELPVVPLATTGRLENLDTGGACTPGGDLGAVSVSGPGANSYTVLALDRATDEIVVVDPTQCATTRLPVGAGPADLATIGRFSWTAAYVANRDGDSVSKLAEGGSMPLTIPVGPGGPACSQCPVAVGVANYALCHPSDLTVQQLDADLDGAVDDLRLAWDAQGCGGSFWVWCQCTEDAPDCPCTCDCSNPAEDPACECPGLGVGGFGPAEAGLGGAGDLALQAPPWPPEPIKNPWKRLGTSIGTTFDHLGVLGLSAGWVYAVTPLETYP